MRIQYLIRLDDACPFMDAHKWQRIEDIMDRFGVKPLVGIIPDAKDKLVVRNSEDVSFWEKAKIWQEKGWAMALHGYDHIYISKEGGLNPLWNRSEYAGVPIEKQRKKMREGFDILKSHGINPKFFFAPSHTFDISTLEVLREETDIRVISDTYALKPYKKYGFAFIPCQIGHPQEMIIPGLFTICLHPNNMNEAQISELIIFLKGNCQNVLSFNDVDIDNLGKMRLIDKIVQWAYFTLRRMRRIWKR